MTLFPDYLKSKKIYVQTISVLAIILLAVLDAPEFAYAAIGLAASIHSYAQGRVDERKTN